MPLPVDAIYDVARATLDVVVAAYIDAGVDLPDRQYVADGTPAWDCDQVTVYAERTFSGFAGQEVVAPLDCLHIRSAVFWVEIARCVPALTNRGAAPTAAAIEASAQVILRDPIIVANALVQAYRDGELGGCLGLVLEGWEGLGPEGGYAGGRQRFRYQLTEAV